jgi:3-hydroxyacyl-CoA dehydrogenase/enoyl-CoA hydratase/3-hydroxybutyryl-CoA epimerase
VLRAEDETALGAGLTQVVQLLQAEVQRGAMTPAVFQKLLGSIRGTYTWTNFERLDILLDTLDSSLDAAREFYQDAERRMPAAALLAPISGLHRIDDLRAGLRYPERLVGLHIIEPWNRGSVAELVATGPLSKEVRRLRDWAVELGKSCLPVPDAAGGLVMRVWLPALNEAGLLVKEGVPVERIDHAMRRFGMSFGPCEWMDRLGIDHVASLISALQPVFAGRIKLESGFALMVEKGWLGAKAEAGFYRSGWRKKQANPEAIQLWKTQSAGEVARPAPTLSQADSVAWIQRRLVTLTVLEAARCLVEGHVKNGDDLDCALCLTGWASHRGGPIGHGRQLGADALSEMCADLAREYGPRYEAPERLRIALHTGDFSGN